MNPRILKSAGLFRVIEQALGRKVPNNNSFPQSSKTEGDVDASDAKSFQPVRSPIVEGPETKDSGGVCSAAKGERTKSVGPA